ncbi:hypothetical protein L2735_18175 [Shewanella olleyana]|uniref:glycosyl hydrolase family 28-related protein n=1 Tax=Shewanella olleyana TaxID=135626 RepID=UPI00200D90E5|nr:glycosyl hydrolase family 28-related protein [Shewanella olleyana]MCL1068699.1 hypothetical protein [Shewanella olleyana]
MTNNMTLAIKCFFFSLLLISLAACTDEEQTDPPAPVEPPPEPGETYTPIYEKFLQGEEIEGGYTLFNWQDTGYKMGEEIPHITGPIFHVNDYGANPNDGQDDLIAIQTAIDEAEKAGGGVVLFDAGQYDLNIENDEDFSDEHAIWVRSANVVLRGAGREKGNGTVIKQWKKSDNINTVSLHTINFHSNEWSLPGVHTITEDVAKGSTRIPLNRIVDVTDGAVVGIRMQAWTAETKPEMSEEELYELTNELLSPLYDSEDREEYVQGPSQMPFFFTTQVKEVTDNNEVILASPIPRALRLKYRPLLFALKSKVNNCGVEDLLIESIHDGSYIEGGYDTGGIAFTNIDDCWVNNVAIQDTTLDISLHNSRHITINDIVVDGAYGHHGIGIYRSDNNLIQNLHYKTYRNHVVTLTGTSSGNVVRNLNNTSDSDLLGIDFHGGFASYNLLENLRNVTLQSSGGWGSNAHSGQYNVVWNLVRSALTGRGDNEAYTYCSYSSYSYDGPYDTWADCYRQHPKTIFVGMTHITPGELVNIKKSPDDIINEWRYVEGLNNPDVQPRSLYEAQRTNKSMVGQ